MSARLDVSGERYGRLVAIKRTEYQAPEDSRKRSWWLFKCDCGEEKIICLEPVRKGKTSSCGCLRTEELVKRSIIHGHKRNRKESRTLNSYKHMISRCYDSSDPKYHRYGERGIKVCDRWRESFLNFLEDMGENLGKLTIERINNDGNYEPGNCRWATNFEQSRNKSTNVFVEWEGQTMILKDFAKAVNVEYKRLHFIMKRDGISHLQAAKLVASPFKG